MLQITNANSTNKSKRRPLFAFGFFSGLLHEDMNEAVHMDKLLERFFRLLYDSGSLENTAVVLFSDHGIRYGDSRGYTRMGWYEENLPFAFIAMPVSFRSRHAAMMKTLRSNRHKLTTPFDLHETIRRVLDVDKPYDDSLRIARGRRGVSLFDITLADRTCKDASIAPTYCECQLSQTHTVDVTSSQVTLICICIIYIVGHKNDASFIFMITLATRGPTFIILSASSFRDDSSKSSTAPIATFLPVLPNPVTVYIIFFLPKPLHTVLTVSRKDSILTNSLTLNRKTVLSIDVYLNSDD